MLPQTQEQKKLSLNDLQSLVQQAMAGDESAFPAIIHVLDQCPDIWQQIAYVTKTVETAWIQTLAKEDMLATEILERQVTALKTSLKAGASSPLEDLVIESIATTWLAYKQAELAAAEQLKHYGNALTQVQQNHLSACQKLYLLAVKELARIRQLLTPRNTTVLNIANQQQVNLT
jgi:NADPH-dependent ferric siderophore reductase